MNSTELLQTIEKVVRDVVNNPSLAVKAESLLVADLGLESIDFLDVSSELENTLGWELDFRELAESVAKAAGQEPDMKSIRVQDLINYIQARG